MTKRLLITGSNKNQCTRKFYLRSQLKVIPSHYSLFNCLMDMGWEVDQRQVKLGEDLSDYDEVIVYIAGPRQLVTTTIYEGLWAISQRPNCIISVDDWQASDLLKGVAKCEDPRELFAQFILNVNKKTLNDVKPFEKQLLEGVRIVTEKRNRTLISAFQTGHLNDADNYGPHLLFGKVKYPRDRLFVFNPHPYHRNRTWEDTHHEGVEDPTWKASALSYTVGPSPAKERRFNFASLVQSRTRKWLKQQGYAFNAGEIGAWPVDLYGSKADSQKRLTEDEMVKVITRDWGCLMPGYEHAGSGWWRVRPQQCADAGSILIGDEKELRVYYGNEYLYHGLKAHELEACSDDALAKIAQEQRKWLYHYHPLDKTVQQAELRAVLEAR